MAVGRHPPAGRAGRAEAAGRGRRPVHGCPGGHGGRVLGGAVRVGRHGRRGPVAPGGGRRRRAGAVAHDAGDDVGALGPVRVAGHLGARAGGGGRAAGGPRGDLVAGGPARGGRRPVARPARHARGRGAGRRRARRGRRRRVGGGRPAPGTPRVRRRPPGDGRMPALPDSAAGPGSTPASAAGQGARRCVGDPRGGRRRAGRPRPRRRLARRAPGLPHPQRLRGARAAVPRSGAVVRRPRDATGRRVRRARRPRAVSGARAAAGRVRAATTTPSWRPWLDWVEDDGRTALARYALTHPAYLLGEPLRVPERAFNNALGDREFYRRARPPRGAPRRHPAGPPHDRGACWSRVWRWAGRSAGAGSPPRWRPAPAPPCWRCRTGSSPGTATAWRRRATSSCPRCSSTSGCCSSSSGCCPSPVGAAGEAEAGEVRSRDG